MEGIMPELPEVETVVRDLRPLLAERTIVSARQSKRKLRRPWKPAWSAEVAGVHIEAVRRRGKWILIDVRKEDPTPLAVLAAPPPRGEGHKTTRFTPPLPLGEGVGGWGLAPLLRIHLGMSGQFTVVPASTPEPNHLHVVFSLDNGNELRFRDPRRFGSAQ